MRFIKNKIVFVKDQNTLVSLQEKVFLSKIKTQALKLTEIVFVKDQNMNVNRNCFRQRSKHER